MQIPVYQIDAFAQRPFAGNPAAVCPLDQWLPEPVMQAIAMENNLSETAFFVARPDGNFDLRWFTPRAEVDLCGHATLATAWLILNQAGGHTELVRFHTRSGWLEVTRQDDGRLALDLPANVPERIDMPSALPGVLGADPVTCLSTRDHYVAIFDGPAAVRALQPDMAGLLALDRWAVIVSAASTQGPDFVTRFFAPRKGVLEDPVTGSAHCVLTPYWAEVLGRSRLLAHQLSERGGELECELRGDRVVLAGHAVPFMTGMIELPEA